MTPKILCHGGALVSRRAKSNRSGGIREAAEAGYAVLSAGGSALDAVVSAVCVLEDAPEFNAGTGSFVQMDGRCRMDACIMTSELGLGAVIQIERVRNPVRVARRVLEIGAHAILAGSAAGEFARREGFCEYDPRTPAKLDAWMAKRKKAGDRTGMDYVRYLRREAARASKLGTVGAVAIDRDGRLAAATSTGGMSLNLPGRVGDVSLVGCGTYADSHAAVSCTGEGEKIMRVVLAREVASGVAGRKSVAASCKAAIARLGAINGKGGVIAVDKKGRLAYLHNAVAMPVYSIG